MINKPDCIEFEELADRFANEIRRGANPQIESYMEQFPEHADTIQRLFPVLELMERNGSRSTDLSESGLLKLEMQQLKTMAAPRQLGDFRIIREIGRGGMGIVFEAEQESLGRKVALKLLPSSAQFDQRRKQRFEQEALATAKLHHTNIVPVYGVGAHEGLSYFVMQFIEGQPLDGVITELSRIRSRNTPHAEVPTKVSAKSPASTMATSIATAISIVDDWEHSETPVDLTAESVKQPSQPFGEQLDDLANSTIGSSAISIGNDGVYWRDVARIGIHVATALDHAHSRKILHRDIKPSNLLFDSTGCTWVTDFGLAKFFESPDLTRTGEVVGTMRYMSPEQLNGVADERSDIFALGLTLYELTVLKPAYDATDRNQLMKQVVDATPKPLRTHNRKVPRDLETIIHKCLAAEPAKRYTAAKDVADDLERFLEGQPVLARRVGPAERLIKWCRRKPAIASLCAALAISLVTGIAGIAVQWQRTADALVLANSNLGEAQRQTNIAKKHFQQARESVSRFFTIVSQQRLLQEPGFQPLRKELLDEALEYHSQFVDQYRDDDELQIELAQSRYYMAEIEGLLSGNPAIVENLEEPIRVFSELIDSDRGEPEHRFWLALCISLKSNLLRRVDINRSLAELQEAIQVLEDLRTDFPDLELGMSELAKNYQMLGLSFEQLDRATGRTDRAFECYSKALSLRQEIHEGRPDDIGNTVSMAEVNRDLGVSYRLMGQFDQAVVHYDRAMEVLQPVVEAHPDNMMARNALGSIANTIGFFYGNGRTQDDYAKALEYYELAKQQYQALVNSNPMVIQYQDGLGRAAINAGSVYQAQGDLERALEYRQHATAIRERLVQMNPNAPHIRSSWAVSLNGVGAVLRDLGEFDQAVRQHQLAHEQHVLVLNADPNQTMSRLRLIDGLVQTSRTQVEGGRFVEAEETLDSIEDVLLATDAQPLFSQGREFVILASKIGQLSAEDLNETLQTQRARCLEKAKSAFSSSAELGYDVSKWSQRDAPFQLFSKYPECREVLDWLNERFGPK